MKRNISTLIATIAAMVVLAVSCEKKTAGVSEIIIYPTDLEMSVGESYTFPEPEILPAGTDAGELVWESDAPKIASVSRRGTVKAVSSGTANISVRAANGVSATCLVHVNLPLSLTPRYTDQYAGRSYYIISNKKVVSWEILPVEGIENPSVISNDGKITLGMCKDRETGRNVNHVMTVRATAEDGQTADLEVTSIAWEPFAFNIPTMNAIGAVSVGQHIGIGIALGNGDKLIKNEEFADKEVWMSYYPSNYDEVKGSIYHEFVVKDTYLNTYNISVNVDHNDDSEQIVELTLVR